MAKARDANWLPWLCRRDTSRSKSVHSKTMLAVGRQRFSKDSTFKRRAVPLRGLRPRRGRGRARRKVENSDMTKPSGAKLARDKVTTPLPRARRPNARAANGRIWLWFAAEPRRLTLF